MPKTTEKNSALYIHPWCGKRFLIKKEFWAIEANPKMKCILCSEKPSECETAKKHWPKQ